VPNFADRGCHVFNVTDPYDCVLGFLDRSHYVSLTGITLLFFDVYIFIFVLWAYFGKGIEDRMITAVEQSV
jgi:hypothetical protein